MKESASLGSERTVLIKAALPVEQGFEDWKLCGLRRKLQGAAGKRCEGKKVYSERNADTVCTLQVED